MIRYRKTPNNGGTQIALRIRHQIQYSCKANANRTTLTGSNTDKLCGRSGIGLGLANKEREFAFENVQGGEGKGGGLGSTRGHRGGGWVGLGYSK